MPTGQTATIPQPQTPETGASGYTYDVFVSCSEKDEAWARSELIQPMRDSRLRVFDEILFGVPQSVVQERSVAQSHYVLVILTEEWCRSFEKQADLLLVAMEDPDASKGRLVPILVKPARNGWQPTSKLGFPTPHHRPPPRAGTRSSSAGWHGARRGGHGTKPLEEIKEFS